MFQEKTGTGGSGTTAGSGKEEAKINPMDILLGVEQAKILSDNLIGSFSQLMTSFQKLDDFSASMAKTFAGANQFSGIIKQNIVEAAPAVTELGGSLEETFNMQLQISKQLQTQTVINSGAFSELYAGVSLVSDASANIGVRTGEVVRKFADAGIGVYQTSKDINGILNQAREIGVSALSVSKAIEENMYRLNFYNFENGVQGMSKMAANAALLRIDMKNTLDFADKVFDPEKAIEMAASFQRLGVQSSALLDPYRLMDLARRNPEKLQEEIGKALSKYAQFNEETKAMEISDFGLAQIRALEEAGVGGRKELTQWALSYGDLQRKVNEIPLSPNFNWKDEDMKKIAGMAQLAEGGEFEGKYVVQVKDEEGRAKEKLVSTLNPEDVKYLVGQQDAAKSSVELQKNSLSMLSTINNTLQAQKDILALSLMANKDVDSGMKNFLKYYLVAAEVQGRVVGLEREKKGEISIFSGEALTGKVDKVVGDVGKGLESFFQKIKEGDFEGAQKDVAAKLVEIGGETGDVLNNLKTKMLEDLKEQNIPPGSYATSILNNVGKAFNAAADTIKNTSIYSSLSDGFSDITSKLKDYAAANSSVTTSVNGFSSAVSAAAASVRTTFSQTPTTPAASMGAPTTPVSVTGGSSTPSALLSQINPISTQPNTITLTTPQSFSIEDLQQKITNTVFQESVTKNINENTNNLNLNITSNTPTLKQDMLDALMRDPQFRQILTKVISESNEEENRKIGK